MTRIKFTEDFKEQPAVIRVIGLGGAGGNAVNRMIEAKVEHVEFIAANTDAQALRRNLAPVRIQVGETLTKGLGVGGNPLLGSQAALESEDRIKEVIQGSDMLFITAGMGGGTGTGCAPVVARIAKSLNPAPLVIAVVTRPFQFEGLVRSNQASAGIEELRPYVDTLLVIPNDKLFEIIDEKTPSVEAFRVADDVLRQAMQAIADVITTHGLVNVDFADVKTIMSGSGEALMGIGTSTGPDRALTAARQAVQSPLLENISIEGAKGVLVNITGNKNVTMFEVREVMDFVSSATATSSHVFYGQVFDENIEDRLKVTVIATGFPARSYKDKTNSSNKRLSSPMPSLQPAGLPNPSHLGTTPSEDDLRRPAYLRLRNRKLK
ncbi:MAG: Cell division protein FtsZ [Elusimicrobia bacterium]|nr:Cell division protein FtsZ [Elusimicrobiota bacterium]